jgi:hypothetical protein
MSAITNTKKVSLDQFCVATTGACWPNVPTFGCWGDILPTCRQPSQPRALPMVGLESVFTTAAIDAKENREVVTINIPGAFLHATNKDYVVMRMNGTLAKLMAKTDPKL